MPSRSILFIDLQNAFDMVTHEELLDILQLLGSRGIAVNWFRSYLTKGLQQVELTYANYNKQILEKIILKEIFNKNRSTKRF